MRSMADGLWWIGECQMAAGVADDIMCKECECHWNAMLMLTTRMTKTGQMKCASFADMNK